MLLKCSTSSFPSCNLSRSISCRYRRSGRHVIYWLRSLNTTCAPVIICLHLTVGFLDLGPMIDLHESVSATSRRARRPNAVTYFVNIGTDSALTRATRDVLQGLALKPEMGMGMCQHRTVDGTLPRCDLAMSSAW